MNEKKKDNMIKDAVILCLITLILGAVLAGVYAVTKDPIDQAQTKANNEACAAVAAEGDKVKDADDSMLQKVTEFLKKTDLANAQAKDEANALIAHVEVSEVHPTENGGYVYLATAKKGYGGDIGFALGMDGEGTITGIAITSQGETAGLGANCEDKAWQDSFKGKAQPANPADNMYNKTAESESQVQALSGATVTSKAITNAVKGVLFSLSSIKEG